MIVKVAFIFILVATKAPIIVAHETTFGFYSAPLYFLDYLTRLT